MNLFSQQASDWATRPAGRHAELVNEALNNLETALGWSFTHADRVASVDLAAKQLTDLGEQ